VQINPTDDGAITAKEVTSEVLDLIYHHVNRIRSAPYRDVLLADIAESPMLSALPTEGKRRVVDVVVDRVTHILDAWEDRDFWHWDEVYRDLFDEGDGWLLGDEGAPIWMGPDHVSNVVACMNARGFTTFGAAEAWLENHPFGWSASEEVTIGGGDAAG
jgi:hypothetical protein